MNDNSSNIHIPMSITTAIPMASPAILMEAYPRLRCKLRMATLRKLISIVVGVDAGTGSQQVCHAFTAGFERIVHLRKCQCSISNHCDRPRSVALSLKMLLSAIAHDQLLVPISGATGFESGPGARRAAVQCLGSFIMVRLLVGATGFEPATSSSRTKRATGLRYAPKIHYCQPLTGPDLVSVHRSTKVIK